MDELKGNFKKYRIFLLSLHYNFDYNGVTIYNFATSSEGWRIFTHDEKKYIESHFHDSPIKVHNLQDVVNFFCNTFNYSVISIGSIDSNYYIVTLIKD